ncbi:MAG: amino acid adenylation domain-containing protein, partial [Calditrichaeota bacterium]|nr:amino acid adenylation domain-containing protein [Calditrichota bacterium]
SRVGAGDNFFEIGGHSLLATQVVSRLRETLGVEVPIRAFFERPTVEGLARVLEDLVRQQRGVSAPPLVRVERSGKGLPLSFAQERLWFLHQLEPESAVYNITEALRFGDDFDPVAFTRSLEQVVRRHEVLRTTFAEENGRPIQVVHEDFSLPVRVVDLGSLNESEAAEEVHRLTRIESRRPFDLEHGPLFRVTLFALPNGDWGVVVVMHHIISDGWSMGVLIRELGAAYQALKRGEELSLPELEIQYGDFAAWQRSWLQGEVLEKELDYWREQLGDSPGYLELPTDRPRPAVKTFAGSKITFELDRDLSEQIRALGRAEGATLFMTLLGAWQALLSRYSGQTDVSVGSVIANRNRRETEGLIGFFVNTLVFRTDLSGNPTFREILRRVREVSLGAYAHQDVPFEKVVEAVQPERDLSHTPLFQVMFVLQNMPLAAGGLGEGVRVESLDADSGLTQYDLTLSMQELGNGQLGGILEYNTDLFDRETVERLLTHYRNFLRQVATNAELRLEEIDYLEDFERHCLLVEWNDTEQTFAHDKCVHELFEEAVDRSPDALALIVGDEEYTYSDIEERSNRLAHYLRERGVGPEVMVGIGMQKSLEMVVAFLGVLKAGGAYVPLDPAYPAERLEFMIEDTGMPLLLSQSDLADRFPAGRTSVLRLDTMAEELRNYPSSRPWTNAVPENLAYVIYTSGSTGRPKGVMAVHRGAVNLAEAYIKLFDLGPGKRVLQFFSFSFDGSVVDAFAAFGSGATLCYAPPEGAMPGPELARFIRDKHITYAILPPSALTVMEPDGLECLEVLGSGGDVCTRDLVAKWLPGRKFYNGYGPTETTVAVSFYFTGNLTPEMLSVPIGRPLQNYRIFVVDKSMRLVPQGVPGELLVGGVGVTRGYLNRPDLTAERFVPDPFSGKKGERLYRTGDLVRLLKDGSIDFLGRIDTQVKVRGYRIELGEVESSLSEHPDVRDAAVVARDDGHGTKTLVAFVAKRPGSQPDVKDLRDHLRDRLPEYMVPSGFVIVDDLPLTPAGKVDRKQLARIDVEILGVKAEHVAPRNETEEQLLQIWEEVLERDSIGVRDNFFEVGGHSLLAIRLLNEIENRFGKQIPLVQLFQKPTIEGLAEYLENGDRASTALVAFNDPGEGTPLFFIHPSGGSVHWYADLARALGPDQPFFGIKAQGAEGEAPFHETIEEMAAHAVRAMRSRQPHGPYYFGSWSMGVVIAYEAAQQLLRDGEEVALLAMLDQGPEFPSAVPDDDTEFLAGMFGPRLKLNLKKLRKKPYEEQLQFVLKKAKKARLLPPNVRDEQFGDYVRLLKTEMMAWKKYQFKPYPGKIVVFRSSERPETQDEPWDLGWGQLAQGGVEVFVVPGNHNTILWKPNVEELAEVLQTIVGAQRAVK